MNKTFKELHKIMYERAYILINKTVEEILTFKSEFTGITEYKAKSDVTTISLDTYSYTRSIIYTKIDGYTLAKVGFSYTPVGLEVSFITNVSDVTKLYIPLRAYAAIQTVIDKFNTD